MIDHPNTGTVECFELLFQHLKPMNVKTVRLGWSITYAGMKGLSNLAHWVLRVLLRRDWTGHKGYNRDGKTAFTKHLQMKHLERLLDPTALSSMWRESLRPVWTDIDREAEERKQRNKEWRESRARQARPPPQCLDWTSEPSERISREKCCAIL